ncbi:HAD-IIIA family hydrolase [Paenibacillus sp. FSL M7-1046]|uniref:HAD-IIIA family hydrolase n=1 Tax=Paenibacillus sp. FSL M7-1046 TaxID=2975315 RepID=UPI0030FB7AF7
MREPKLQAVFIDRDGTLGGSDEVQYPVFFELFPFTPGALNTLKFMGLKLYGFTNQPGISRGEATEEAFRIEMLEFGFDGVYICPHQHNEGCHCRKPNPGMLIRAAQENNLDLSKCAVIGDRWTDMVAADRAGCMKVLVMTGAGNAALNEYRNKWLDTVPDYIAGDFADAVTYIEQYVRGVEEPMI